LPVDKRPSEAEQSDTVAYLLGWIPGGSAMRHYNRRFIKEKARKVVLRLQEENETAVITENG